MSDTAGAIRATARGLFFVGVGAIGFAAYQSQFEPNARIFTNVDDSTPLNHGQKSISVTLPRGLRFSSLGGCHADWTAPGLDWDSVTIEIEAFDPQTGGYRPKPFGGGWLKLEDADGQ